MIELLVVISIIAILLAALLSPALSGAKGKTKQSQCANNLRQIHLPLQIYADGNSDEIPPRNYGAGPDWIHLLLIGLANRELLRCPADVGVVTDSSYLMNGFIDFFLFRDFNGNWDQFFDDYKSGGFPALKLAQLPQPSETITFGEKKHRSGPDPYMDMWPPAYGGDLTEAVDNAKHRSGSNHGFVDGSVRFPMDGTAIRTKNLWATTEQFRDNPPP